MRFMSRVFILNIAALTFTTAAYADAGQGDQAGALHARPSEAQMESVRACAAKEGVNLPPRPRGRPDGQPPGSEEHPPGPPPGNGPPTGDESRGDHNEGPNGGPPGAPPPRLTESEKKIVDGCFAANGLAPPQHHERPNGPPPEAHGPATGADGRAGPPPDSN